MCVLMHVCVVNLCLEAGAAVDYADEVGVNPCGWLLCQRVPACYHNVYACVRVCGRARACVCV